MPQTEWMKNPQLEGDDFFWKGNRTGVLLIHGFTATTAEVRLIAEKLHQDGFTVSGPLLPGHGTSPEDLNRVTWPLWVARVKEAYEALARETDQVFVIAESMGAVLAIELAAQHPEIAGLLLFAPAIKARNLWLARFLAPFKNYLEKSGKDDGLPWKGYTVYPVKAAVEFLKLQKHAKQRLGQVSQPAVVFTGEYDRTITPDAAQVVLDGLGSKEKEHVHMGQSAHCILLGQELDQAHQDILAFIQRHS